MQTQKLGNRLLKLLPAGAPPRVSVYVSLEHESPTARDANAIRWKNARGALERNLEDTDLEEKQVSEILNHFDLVVENDESWDLRGQALALFGGTDGFQGAYLPRAVDDQVHVGDEYYVLPALPALTNQPTFAILNVDQERARILFVHGRKTTEKMLLTDGVSGQSPDEHQRDDQLQMHTAGKGNQQGGAIFHGQGQDEHAAEERRRRWVDDVAQALAKELYNSHLPVVCATDETLFGILREENEYPLFFAEDCLPAPVVDKLPENTIDQAREWIRNKQEAEWVEQLNKVRAAIAHEQGATKLGAIKGAAEQGKVATLILANSLDESAGAHDVRTSLSKQQVDINVAALRALETDANVIVIPTEKLPEGNTVMASYRY